MNVQIDVTIAKSKVHIKGPGRYTICSIFAPVERGWQATEKPVSCKKCLKVRGQHEKRR